MRKLLYLLMLITTGVAAQTNGLKTAVPLIRNNVADTYPVTYSNLQNGGYHSYLTIAGRDSLNTVYPQLLRNGMRVRVGTGTSSVDYIWNSTTSSWEIASSGGGGGSINAGKGLTKTADTLKLGDSFLLWRPRAALSGGAGGSIISGGQQLLVGDRVTEDPAGIVVARTVVGTDAAHPGFLHAVQAADDRTLVGNAASADFDALSVMRGSGNFNHQRAFQARNIYAGSNTLDESSGLTLEFIHQGSGQVANRNGILIRDFSKQSTGGVDMQVGIRFEDLVNGNDNYGILSYSNTLRMYWGGPVRLATNLQVDGSMNTPLLTAQTIQASADITSPLIKATDHFEASTSFPKYVSIVTNAAADEKISDIISYGNQTNFRFLSDNQSNGSTWLNVTRSGYNTTAINFTTPVFNIASSNTNLTGNISTIGGLGSGAKGLTYYYRPGDQTGVVASNTYSGGAYSALELRGSTVRSIGPFKADTLTSLRVGNETDLSYGTVELPLTGVEVRRTINDAQPALKIIRNTGTASIVDFVGTSSATVASIDINGVIKSTSLTASTILKSDANKNIVSATPDVDFLTPGTASSTYATIATVATKATIVSPPATSTSTGTAGQVAYDSNYFYYCYGTNQWARIPKDGTF